MNWRIVAPILSIVLCGCVAKVEQPAPPKPQAAKRANDPCSLLTQREATEALGQRVTQAAPPAPTYCRYATPASDNAPTALSVTFGIDDDVASYDKFVTREDAAAVAGLGDRAVWNTNGNSVVVVKGNRRLILTIVDGKTPSTLTESDLQQRAVAAAQKIVDRM